MTYITNKYQSIRLPNELGMLEWLIERYPNSGYHKVSMMGLVGINTHTPDQRSALHVNGALKFNDKLHFSADAAPTMNSYTKGDICWNDNPQAGKQVGWVCVQSGTPGIWNGFGRIE